jgi:hypothetical protein
LAPDLELLENDDTIRKPYIPIRKPPVPCHFVPASSTIHPLLETMELFLQDYMKNNPARYFRSRELSLLQRLNKTFPEIIFKASDKNLGLTALNLNDYDKMVMAHLSNKENYTMTSSHPIGRNRTLSFMKDELVNFIENYPGFYRNEMKYLETWLQTVEPAYPKFYCLPKLHKQGPLKGRPIAGAVKWVTTPISKILNQRLGPLLIPFETILKNSETLVRDLDLLNGWLPKEPLLLITADVVSLYPNINVDYLQKLLRDLDITLEPMVQFVCKNSYVEYCNRVYLQKKGIAMGTNAAVHLANYYMYKVIDKHIKDHPLMHYYRRYIDDLFFLWKGSLDEWKQFQTFLNNISQLNFEFSKPSYTSTVFLDLNIHFYAGKFHTSVYQKELNKYFYITPTSNHVPHTFSGFVKGELTRYARLSSDPTAYETIKKLFYGRLLKRGYSRLYLNRIFVKHHWNSRTNDRSKPTSVLLPMVIPHTPRRNIHVLESFFKDQKSIFCDYIPNSSVKLVFSKTPNTLQIVSTSDLGNSQKQSLLETHSKRKKHGDSGTPKRKKARQQEPIASNSTSNSMKSIASDSV